MQLLRETLPLAVAFAMSVIYFRVLVVLVSLLSTEVQTGLFGTSFRIFEMLLGLPALILSVALPLLSVAGDEDDSRLRRALQSMTEASLVIATLLVIGIGILAEPGIRLVGGEEYIGAVPVLRIQALALIPVFLVQTWQLGLIAGRAQRAMAVANGLALVAGASPSGSRSSPPAVPRLQPGSPSPPRRRSPSSSGSLSAGRIQPERRTCGLRGRSPWQRVSLSAPRICCATQRLSPRVSPPSRSLRSRS